MPKIRMDGRMTVAAREIADCSGASAAIAEQAVRRSRPLVVDLDGTLTPADTLVESVIQLVKQAPMDAFRIPLWALRGRLSLKSEVAARARIDPALLPYRPALLEYLHAEKQTGRLIILATAAHQSIANGVAAHLDLFGAVLATDTQTNLKGCAKLEAIRHLIGGDFVYAGDSQADIPIWQSASSAILVGTSPALTQRMRQQGPVEREFPQEVRGFRVWMHALRVHQWLKNLLIFVPLFTAFSFAEVAALATTVLAFLSFSFAASATYLINDLWDLESDRAHPRKRLRPFASASIPILNGLAAAAGLLIAASIVAWFISPAFLSVLALYVLLTSTYSWVLKEYVLVDVLMLSVLYTLRILAGSVAIGVATSSWLLAFSVFVFLSLALVKRCAELVSLETTGSTATRGRDYRVSDLAILWPLGVGAALSSVVVFGLFISAPDTRVRYASPSMLWLVAIGLIYWLARLWIKTSRGEMHDDPVIYAIKDFGSRITLFGMIAVVLASHFVSVGFLQ
jgi:4-hydroxybenzoate polyprenyltransferase/phosphoserine phosphatase